MKQKHIDVTNKMLALSEEQRLDYADRRLWKIQCGLRDLGYSCAKIHETILGIFRLFVSADLSCDQGEKEFFDKLTGSHYSNDQFFAMTNRGRKEEFLENTLKWMKSLGPDLFTQIFTVGGLYFNC